MEISCKTIKRLCKEQGITLRALAIQLGVSYNTIYSASKRGRCSKELAETIAQGFNVDLSYLLGEPIDTRIGQAIRKYREDQGMTQEQLADGMRCTKAAISRYEKGERTPRIEVLLDICQICKVDISKFLQEAGYIMDAKQKVDKNPCCSASLDYEAEYYRLKEINADLISAKQTLERKVEILEKQLEIVRLIFGGNENE